VTGNICIQPFTHRKQVDEALPHLLDDEAASSLAEIYKALSDPTRLRIVSLLVDAELCVCDLAAALGMGQSAVSHQLRTLRELRLVRWRRTGRKVFYTLDDEHVADLYRRGLEHLAHE
jgi:DNA-binding transcriptional ArsR family regulator